MSASLVGSEMCIRDRLKVDRSRWTAKGPNSWPTTTIAWSRNTLRNSAGCCLLYTSDAADDM
eukprot:11776990-Alexandrium_andersonii.AAC.1